MHQVANGESLRCSACGGTHLAWRVRKLRNAGSPASERTLVWLCRDCGSDRVGRVDSLDRNGALDEGATSLPLPAV